MYKRLKNNSYPAENKQKEDLNKFIKDLEDYYHNLHIPAYYTYLPLKEYSREGVFVYNPSSAFICNINIIRRDIYLCHTLLRRLTHFFNIYPKWNKNGSYNDILNFDLFLFSFCVKLECDKIVLNIRNSLSPNSKIKTYPACASVCFDPQYKLIRSNAVSKNIQSDKGFNQQLKNLYSQTFNLQIGKTPKSKQFETRFPLGCCSEQQAVNTYLNSIPSSKVDDLKISVAMRPRTMQYVLRCANCKDLFQNN